MQAQAQRDGIILFAVLASISALALLAGTIAIIATADIRMAAAFKRTADAFYNTESGVQYVKSCIEADLATNAISLSSPVIAVNYTAPTGMTCDTIQQITRTANTNAYTYSVIGHEVPARCRIEVVFRRSSLFELGLFGDEQFVIKNDGSTYIYDSRENHPPGPSNSIGGATIASNGEFETKHDSYIDGSFMLGSDTNDAPGTWKNPSSNSVITGEANLPTDRIDPDPLGAIVGDLAADFITASITNNNANADPAMNHPQYNVSIGNNATNKLPSGDYYINDLEIKNGGTLAILATNGPVNIYLTGELEAKEGSAINCTGRPTDLFIYSNSDDSIILKNSGNFAGLIYAPYADITILNTAAFYGTAWGKTLDIRNSGDVYIDAALMDAFPGNRIKILSWKEIRAP